MTTLAASMGRSPRMTLVNVATQEYVTVQFNPAEFEETIGAAYARQVVPGLSHKVLQFINTENETFTFDLFHQATNGGPEDLAAILLSRRFLLSVCHPRRADGLIGAGAPRVMFIWPKLITLTCVVTSVKLKYTRFNGEGAPVSFIATTTLEEIRDTHVTAEDILELGTQRGAKGPNGLG
jgi:hypothetical protein